MTKKHAETDPFPRWAIKEDSDGAYALQQWPMAAPCCWWDAAETPEHFDADISGAELRWFEPGRAPALSSLPLASIELDDLFATAANDHQLTVTRNPMLAQSCRQRPLL
jgi:hypothetical protein